jgi:integrase
MKEINERWTSGTVRYQGQRLAEKRFDTKSQASAYIKDFKKRIDENSYVPPSKVKTFPEVAEHWVQRKITLFQTKPTESVAPVTIGGYQRQVKVWSDLVGPVPCDELSFDLLDAAYLRLSYPKDQGGYAITDPGRFKTVLGSILRHGMRHQFGVQQDFTQLMDRAKKRKVRRITRDEISNSQGLKELIMAVAGRFKLFIMLIAYSGLRIGEVMALQMKHIDNPKKGYIRVEQSLSTGKIKGIDQPPYYSGHLSRLLENDPCSFLTATSLSC